MKRRAVSFIIILVTVVAMLVGCAMPVSAQGHCIKSGCTRKRSTGSSYCYVHKPSSGSSSSSSSSYSSGKSYSKKRNSYSGKSYDYYGVHNYKSAQDFADDKYEEFYDYEDDYDDEDEAYDAAEDYWNDNY
jgi:hypothetical protein